MQVEMHDAVATIGKLCEPVRRFNVMKLAMEIGKLSRMSRDGPRTPRDRVEHRRAIDAIHDDLAAVGAHVVDCRDRQTSGMDEFHDSRLVLDAPPVASTPKHQVGSVLENVAVAAPSE